MRTLKTILLSIFCLFCGFLFLLQPSAASEKKTELSRIYTSFINYMYTPYFEKSNGYQEFKETLNAVSKVLKQTDATDSDFQLHYNRLKETYRNLMLSTFDYTSLSDIAESYSDLDLFLFSEKSKTELKNAFQAVSDELDSPTLFQRSGKVSEKEYRNAIQTHITEIVDRYLLAFDSLELIVPSDHITKSELDAVIRFLDLCLREEIFGENSHWIPYLESKKSARALLQQNDPAQVSLNSAISSLLLEYEKLCQSTYDTQTFEAETEHFRKLNSHDFTPASWSRYQEAFVTMNNKANQVHFLYFGGEISKEECQRRLNVHSDFVFSNVFDYRSILVSAERAEFLKSLCDENRTVTTLSELEMKKNILLNHVRIGDELLQSDSTTPEEVEFAIQSIQNAKAELNFAERLIQEEQEKSIRQDKESIRKILIFSAFCVLLSLFFAIFLSRHYYGKTDWTK